jgi:hypothetical protein
MKDQGFGALSTLVWHAKLDVKRGVLGPASPLEAGQSVNPGLTWKDVRDRNNVGKDWIFLSQRGRN